MRFKAAVEPLNAASKLRAVHFQYAPWVTRRTQGIDRASLKVGQHVVCTVTARLAIVLSATIAAEPAGDGGDA